MIAALLAKIGLEAGVKTSGRLFGLILITAFIAFASFGFWRGLASIDAMVVGARLNAITERDAYWLAEINKSNASAESARADQAINAARASAEAETKITGLQAALTELEIKNANLPNGAACGLDAGRVRLLNR